MSSNSSSATQLYVTMSERGHCWDERNVQQAESNIYIAMSFRLDEGGTYFLHATCHHIIATMTTVDDKGKNKPLVINLSTLKGDQMMRYRYRYRGTNALMSSSSQVTFSLTLIMRFTALYYA